MSDSVNPKVYFSEFTLAQYLGLDANFLGSEQLWQFSDAWCELLEKNKYEVKKDNLDIKIKTSKINATISFYNNCWLYVQLIDKPLIPTPDIHELLNIEISNIIKILNIDINLSVKRIYGAKLNSNGNESIKELRNSLVNKTPVHLSETLDQSIMNEIDNLYSLIGNDRYVNNITKFGCPEIENDPKKFALSLIIANPKNILVIGFDYDPKSGMKESARRGMPLIDYTKTKTAIEEINNILKSLNFYEKIIVTNGINDD